MLSSGGLGCFMGHEWAFMRRGEGEEGSLVSLPACVFTNAFSTQKYMFQSFVLFLTYSARVPFVSFWCDVILFIVADLLHLTDLLKRKNKFVTHQHNNENFQTSKIEKSRKLKAQKTYLKPRLL